MGGAHASRFHLQHQGFLAADASPDEGLRRSTRTCVRRPTSGTSTPRTSTARSSTRCGSASCRRWLRCTTPASCRAAVPVPAVVPDLARQQGVSVAGQGAVRAVPGLHRVPQSATWMSERTAGETLDFLRTYALPYVCVDMPQGYASSIPPVVAATSPDVAVVRFHGHSEKWNSRDIYERFGYLYDEAELAEWAPSSRSWPADRRDPRAAEQLLRQLRAGQRAPAGDDAGRCASPLAGFLAGPKQSEHYLHRALDRRCDRATFRSRMRVSTDPGPCRTPRRGPRRVDQGRVRRAQDGGELRSRRDAGVQIGVPGGAALVMGQRPAGGGASRRAN